VTLLRERGKALAPGARRIIRFIADNPALALAHSAAQLGTQLGTSDASIVRAAQALGYTGLPELKRALAASLDHSGTPAEAMRHTLADTGAEVGSAVDLVIATHRAAIEVLAAPAARATTLAAVAVLQPARRVLVFGIGPSGPLARYTALLLRRIGRAARELDATGIALADQLLDLTVGDVLLVLAYGQAYREVVAVLAEAHQRNLPIVLVTDSLEERLARQADVVVPARRGHTGGVALHGTTLVLLEAIILGLAATDGQRAVTALERLDDLRAAVAGVRRDLRSTDDEVG
jgi:DNA-binding MurR/RpiR family transcriptional regulator